MLYQKVMKFFQFSSENQKLNISLTKIAIRYIKEYPPLNSVMKKLQMNCTN